MGKEVASRHHHGPEGTARVWLPPMARCPQALESGHLTTWRTARKQTLSPPHRPQGPGPPVRAMWTRAGSSTAVPPEPHRGSPDRVSYGLFAPNRRKPHGQSLVVTLGETHVGLAWTKANHSQVSHREFLSIRLYLHRKERTPNPENIFQLADTAVAPEDSNLLMASQGP